jgi:predicted TPR repeat methyltransferase
MTPTEAIPEPLHRRVPLLWALLLVLVCGAVYVNSLEGGYHLDDFYRIQNNHEVAQVRPMLRHFTDPRTSSSIPQLVQFRPLLPLSLSLTAAAGDALGLERLKAHHLGNLALHLVTVLLIFALGVELLRRGPPETNARRVPLAFAAALLFGLHPVAGVPVNYLCARDLLLMNLLLLAALLVYARMRRGGGDSASGWVAVVCLLALSLCSKTNAAVAFAVVFAFEVFLCGASLRDRGLWLRTGAVGAVCAGLFAWTRRVGFSDYAQLKIDDRGLFEYPLTQLDVHVFYYLRNVLWPLDLRPLPSIDAVTSFEPWQALRVLVGGLIVVGSLLLALRLRRRRPVVAFAIVVYWVLFSLTSSIAPLRSLATDYRQVPSLVFLALAFAAGPLAVLPPRAAGGLLLALGLWFGGVSWHMNEVWRTEESLWGHAVARGATGRAHMNYGLAMQSGHPDVADEHYQIALLETPGDVYTRINLGLLRLQMGRVNEGLAEVQRAVDQTPHWALTHFWLAHAHRQCGNKEIAARESRRAAELDPRNAEYVYTAARDHQALGDAPGSLPLLLDLAELVGKFRDSLFLEGFARQKSGRRDLAIELYDRFLVNYPDHYQATFNRAYALMNSGRHAAAAEGYKRTLQLNPNYKECHLHLAVCYRRLDRPEQAAEHQRLYEQ